MRAVVAFDTEGDGSPHGFICGAVVSAAGVEVYADRGEMLRGLTCRRNRGAWVWAHNLEYDLGVLTGGDLSVFTLLYANGRLLYADTRDPWGHKFRFCDSTNIFPRMTVADLGAMVGLPKLSPPEALYEGATAFEGSASPGSAGYAGIREYCVRDAEIVYQSVNRVQADLLELGGGLTPTIAGCAMDLYRRRYQDHGWKTPHLAVNQVAHSAYYGGRVEPYRLGTTASVNVYDVNSLYPAAQRQATFPDPAHLTFDLNPTSRTANLRYPGFSHVTVDLPESAVGLLPVHTSAGLYFPWGRLAGCWTHNELRSALEHGAELLDVHWSWYSPRGVKPFVEYVDEMYALKSACDPAQAGRRQTIKLLLNSLYGRWGVGGVRGLQVLQPVRDTTDLDDYPGAELRMIADRPYMLVDVSEDSQPAYANTLWAAVITAEARAMMLPHLCQHAGSAVYTDTDSLCLVGELLPGAGLGGWREEYHAVEIRTYAPKEYVLSGASGTLDVRCKGVPAALREEYLAGRPVTFVSPAGILEASASNGTPAVWVERTRTRHVRPPKRAPLRAWAPTEASVETRPWTTRELVRLVESAAPQLCPVPVCLDP